MSVIIELHSWSTTLEKLKKSVVSGLQSAYMWRMNTSSEFQKNRKHAIVSGAFAAALSAVSGSMLNDGNRIAGFIIIAVQAVLIVLAVRYLFLMKTAGKASPATES